MKQGKTAENGKLTITANCRNLFGRLGQNVKNSLVFVRGSFWDSTFLFIPTYCYLKSNFFWHFVPKVEFWGKKFGKMKLYNFRRF